MFSTIKATVASRTLFGKFALFGGILLLILAILLGPPAGPREPVSSTGEWLKPITLVLNAAMVLSLVVGLILMSWSGSALSRGWLRASLCLDSLPWLLYFFSQALLWLLGPGPQPKDFFPDVGYTISDWLSFAAGLLWLNSLGWDLFVFLPEIFRLSRKPKPV